ncbi:MAG: flagellar type III secretion system protein FlhB, partial [Caldimonas sp.]
MAETHSQEKSLPASPRKLQKARADGDVARSRDLDHFAAIAVGGALLAAFAPSTSGWLKQLLMQGLRFDAVMLRDPGFMTARLAELTLGLLKVVVPFGLAMIGVAVAGGFAVSGLTFTLKPMAPRFDKLNPLTGLTRILTKAQLIDAAKAVTLALILGTIGALYLKSHIESFAGVLAMPLPAAIGQIAQTVLGGLGLLLLALGAFAVIDVPLQRFQHGQRLRMSHQDVKQENKETEGNGEVKAKVRARMREMTKRRMLAAVPQADLVVMNPTHYAVALKYDDASMGAPRVVAKGADLLALKIRDTAQDSKVPVLEAPALARALYAHAELDREIPAALFAAVAQVLAYVYQLRAALKGRGAMPGDLPPLEVPDELDPHHGKPPTAPDLDD